MGTRQKLLYVEDDPTLRSATARMLGKDYELTLAEDGTEALHFLSDQDFDVILSDIEMSQMDGVTLYEEITKTKPEQARRFVFYTGGVADMGTRTRLQAIPDRVQLDKPVDIATLRCTLARVANSKH